MTLRGMNGQAFSVVVTRGHGYIKPNNFKDFTGGTVTVQGEAILPVAKDMLLVVPEGQQLVTMKNGDLMAEVTVEVKRGQVTKVDMAKYQNQVPDTARVTFDVNPQGAELYVNASLTVHINLAEESADVETDSSDSSSSVSDDSSSSSSESSVTYDNDHKVTVSAPVGAAVYVNGTYKGEVPCSFTKVIGNVTLSLTKDGYETKTYAVEISDDSKDISWSFPDLTKNS